ncbi:hypothetical protein HU200_030147 [Digitaria exilis]|uniref:Uncharacterized protein n=1 Tax=Digitaria exilis TaxID=1010633 RepID=A0A835BXV8_9POAL|nr:hypothetical protein HU200_030147 [Digitaria exilis]
MDTYFDLPSAITSCIMHGRQLYYRLVFLLGMDPSLSIEIIAFWLLVEGNGEVDFLRHINSFHGDNFLALVGLGKQFIDAIHGNPVGLKSTSSAREFHGQVIFGICFLLNNVCYKVLHDLRRKVEQGLAIINDMEESPNLLQYMKNQPHASTSFRRHRGDHPISGRNIPSVTRSSGQIIVPPINHQDRIKMRNGAQSMNGFTMDLDFVSPQQRKIIEGNISSISDIHGLELLFRNCTISPQIPSDLGNKSPQSFTMNMDPYVHSPVQHHSQVPQDSKTLFVTFSNGHPFTKVEVYDFFMR